MWQKCLIAAALCCAPLTTLQAQTTAPVQPKASLIDAWLSLPNVGEIAWPYAYMRASNTSDSQKAHRADLFEQFEQLRWRLNDGGYSQLANAISSWKNELLKTDDYRQPGDWSPSWLMSHPNKRPPVSRIAAIGYCDAPNTIRVWDAVGVHRRNWQPGIRLSDLLEEDENLSGGSTDEVALVWPRGDIDHYGVAAWNYADTELTPGTNIIGAIDLKGAVFPWMRDAIAGLLAHTPVGENCRDIPLGQGAENG
ncbi:capsule biosynthesis GfcC family protein [Salinisphaera sp. SPP-AMP-43]|uniref:capsule biosynthesis GfcC family protein n=1 Tax=Salinisphaera sp. SPP-AMP-43 TaxID=3121288 RepID=UPI003C6E58C5